MDNPLSAFEDFQRGKPYRYIGSGCAYLFLSDGTISLKHLDSYADACEIVISDETNIIVHRNPLNLAGIVHCRKCGLVGYIINDMWIGGINHG